MVPIMVSADLLKDTSRPGYFGFRKDGITKMVDFRKRLAGKKSGAITDPLKL